MATILHDSDCSVHNEPAMPNGPCDCGADNIERQTAALRQIADMGDYLLLDIWRKRFYRLLRQGSALLILCGIAFGVLLISECQGAWGANRSLEIRDENQGDYLLLDISGISALREPLCGVRSAEGDRPLWFGISFGTGSTAQPALTSRDISSASFLIGRNGFSDLLPREALA